jgi:DNA-binding NarL/FixJ family response regulator
MSAIRIVRVMLVEDHAAFRQSLPALLSREPDLEVVAQAGSLAQARQMLDTPLDVAVLDLSLPDGDGRELIGELRQSNAGISILVLSVMLGPSHLEEVLKAGADAVLHKVASPQTIVEEVRRLGWRLSHPQEHDDCGCWLPRTAYYSRTSENSVKREFYFGEFSFQALR